MKGLQMNELTKTLIGALLVATTSYSAFADERLTHEELQAILADKTRTDEDSKRDEARKPVDIMYFSEVARGDNVLDLFAGGGWYTELFSKAVGAKGKVYAQNDNLIWQFAEKGIKARTSNNRLPNVQRLDKTEIVDMPVKLNSVDLVFTALNYHDLFFTHTVRDGEIIKLRDKPIDHKAALAKLSRILKNDGLFVIVDHIGVSGSGYNAPNDLHRIDPEIVKYQMKEAGFKLVEEAYYLRNQKDDLSSHVFSEDIRGRTDRFIYKFKKEKY